ncbi:MAG: class I tRNA ligase family protein [Spirochaetales bacterium]|nr:class I tRNA ligase family protein [Spirochaetales bacterium]
MSQKQAGFATLHLKNTLTRKIEEFKPMDGKSIRIFTCGPSLYRRPHIGNYITFLYEDILVRYLEFLGYKVKRVMNFTDIEDKGLKEAKAVKMSLKDLIESMALKFYEETSALNIKLPASIPRASTTIRQTVILIKKLLEAGYAYWYKGDIFYDPLKFKDFGILFGIDTKKWPKKKKRFYRDNYPDKQWNRGDFILWHGYKKDDGNVYWETDLGKGRPAWNIQDPAIITEHLGYRIDIACGGSDNLYMHHDYNKAIIESISGKCFARYWLHGEHLFYEGKKMSKKLGNIVYLEHLLNNGNSSAFVRFFLIYRHYRKKLNYTEKRLDSIKKKYTRFMGTVAELTKPASGIKGSHPEAAQSLAALEKNVLHSMNSDLDVKAALDALLSGLTKLQSLKIKEKFYKDDAVNLRKMLSRLDSFLKIFPGT